METENQALSGKVAVITGAGRGIGKAIALAYAGAGAAVCCAARTLSEVEETVSTIKDAGGQGLAVSTDVTQLDAVEQMYKETTSVFGGIDILVANAGVSYHGGPVAGSESEEWLKTIEVNLFGVYFCTKAVIPYLRERGGGKIITIGSGLGHKGTAGGSAYACSKAGSWMLTRVLAQELAADNISVNELIPGPVITPMTADTFGKGIIPPVMESEWMKEAEDVAPLALFLAIQPDTGPSAQSYSLMRRDT